MNWFRYFEENGFQSDRFTVLNPDMLLTTVVKLENRIYERFPQSGLLQVCRELGTLTKECSIVAERLGPPIWPLRFFMFGAAFMLIGLVAWAITQIITHFSVTADGLADLLQATESAINELIFLAIALFFLVGLESRIKRRAALRALHRLRSIAHVIDMHQLTKDPAILLAEQTHTASSPQRMFSRYELSRYLDYCSEMLALTAKTAALFAENTEDESLLTTINDLEQLTQGLSAKIWQKIMILDLAQDRN
jgi:hypothetical protein